MGELLFISYYFNQKDGVGALRSLALYNMLKEKEKQVKAIHKNTFKSEQNFILWIMNLLIYIIKNKPKTIYVTCGPYNHIYPISLICKVMRINLLIDFRDPWSLNISSGYGKQKIRPFNKVKLLLATFIEKRVYKTCKYFIVCTKGMKDEYTKLFKDNSKILLITNGHNIKEFKKIKTNKGFLNFVCIGKFAEYDITKSCLILRKIEKYCRINQVDYKIHLIGSEVSINKKAIRLSEVDRSKVKIYSKMNYEDAVQLASKFDIGLCILRNENLEYGTKIFDYIGLGLPVMGVFNKNDNFYQCFNKFIVEKEIPTIPPEEREKFSRKKIFAEYLYIFDGE